MMLYNFGKREPARSPPSRHYKTMRSPSRSIPYPEVGLRSPRHWSTAYQQEALPARETSNLQRHDTSVCQTHSLHTSCCPAIQQQKLLFTPRLGAPEAALSTCLLPPRNVLSPADAGESPPAGSLDLALDAPGYHGARRDVSHGHDQDEDPGPPTRNESTRNTNESQVPTHETTMTNDRRGSRRLSQSAEGAARKSVARKPGCGDRYKSFPGPRHFGMTSLLPVRRVLYLHRPCPP